MNNQAVRSAQPGVSLAQGVVSVWRAAGLLLAHVRETIGRGGSGNDHDLVVGMNAYMRRDIGGEGAIGPHASANRDLLYPRL